MSQSGSESDIWDYKPLKKTKINPSTSGEHGTTSGKGRKSSKTKNKRKTNVEDNEDAKKAHQQTPSEQGQVSDSLRVHHGTYRDAQDKDAESGGFCPVCQMPFSILVVQSQQWHVAECLDTPGEESKGIFMFVYVIIETNKCNASRSKIN